MLHRINLATGASTDIKPRAPKGQAEYRFNWNAPLLLSPHNPRTLYFGGNHVFRSVDRGAHWQVISKDLTGRSEPGPSSDLGHTLTTLAESPLKAGVLYVGSDDGRLCLTRDGGNTWTDLSANLPGLPAERMISRVECSHAAEGTAYVSVDRHRNDDRRPYVYKTADFGATWQLLADGLPADGPVHVVREDPRNPELLFAGTEFGLFTSLDAGSHWLPLKGKLPVVAVHDLLVHPRDRDLVIATHGRGVYVLDVAPLEEWTGRARDGAAYLFDIRPASAFQPHGSRGLANPGLFAAANPAYGAAIFYNLKDKPAGPVRLTIQDVLGNPVASLQGAQEPGLHQRVWDLRSGADAEKKTPERSVTPGDYVVTLEVGQQMLRRKVHVELEE
jgi:hypothetical protein